MTGTGTRGLTQKKKTATYAQQGQGRRWQCWGGFYDYRFVVLVDPTITDK